MYIYNVGYSSCEDSDYYQYSHENKFSKDELKEIVFECFCDIYPDLRKDENKPLTFDDLLISTNRFDNDTAFHKAMELQGFQRLKFESTFSIFGWADCINNNDRWGTYTDELEEEFQRRMKEKFHG